MYGQQNVKKKCVTLFVYDNVVYVPSRFIPRGVRYG